ncbi:TolC family protein [bacterium]|nr:TolC family protein [bacterium]
MSGLNKKTVTIIMMVSFSIGLQAPFHRLEAQPSNIEFGKEAAVTIAGKRISIGDAIRLAIESNYDLLSGAYELAMLDSNFRMYQKKYSPFFSVAAGGVYQEYPESTSSLTGTDSKTWSASAALAKKYVTGTQLTLGVSHDKSSTTFLPMTISIPGLSFGDPDYTRATAFVSLQQELLQNGFGVNEQLEQKQIANAGFVRKEVILYQLSLVVVKVIMEYWNVVLKESALTNAALQYAETKSVRDITERNVNLGTTNRFELHYYNVLVAGAKAQWMFAEQDYKNARRGFLRSVNLADGAVLEGAAVLVNELPEIDKKDALDRAYAKRADYLGAKRMLDHAAWDLAIAGNLALPSLTAELSVNTMGQQTDASGAWQDMLGAEQVGYAGKLALVYPLGDPVQTIKERNARFAHTQAEISVRKYERLIADEIDEQVEQMKTVYQLYRISKEARIEAEIFYKSMMNQLRRGRLNAAMVKNGVDALTQGRQQELETLIQFNTIQLQFIVTKNELFETFGIDPNDYIPE